MKQLFLTSSASTVITDVIRFLPKPANTLTLTFITTAAEVEEGDRTWLENDKKALTNAGFTVFDYTVTNKTADEVKKTLEKTDIIFFEGGNTFYLLQKLQRSNALPIIKDLVHKGKIYIGSSAGSQIAGPDIYSALRPDKIKQAPNIKDYKALGLVDFIVFPHWGSEYFKDVYMNFRMKHAYTMNDKIILLTDSQYIRVIDDMYQIIEIKKG